MDANQKLELILARTGIGAKLAAEAEESRVAQHAELRKRRAASVDKYLKAKPAAEAAIAAADKKQRDVQKAADDALKEYIKAREQFETVHGTHESELAVIDREMLTCYDPRIDEFIASLQPLKDACVGLAERGPYEPVRKRVVGINEAKDAAMRLRTRHDVDDVPAELERILNAIPRV